MTTSCLACEEAKGTKFAKDKKPKTQIHKYCSASTDNSEHQYVNRR
jgi:hypothetical protein